jgi:hypothetical protein
MPCFIAAIAFFSPRLVLVVMWLFSDYLGRAYQTVLWPLLGFFVLPCTTLAYAWAINSHGKLEGLHLAVFVVALLVDMANGSGQTHSVSRRRARRA